MGIFDDIIMELFVAKETKEARECIAKSQEALKRIESGMVTKEDISSVLGECTPLSQTSLSQMLHNEIPHIPSIQPILPGTTASPLEKKNMIVQSIVCDNDIRYFAQQPQSELTLMVGQMTSLLDAISDTKNNTDTCVSNLKNQGWFKRMWNTITGKNRATKEEIRRNQDKIVGYISEAVAQLYKMNLIEMQIMQSLGNRINQVYAQLVNVYNEQLYMKTQIAELQQIQYQTIQSLGEIANALNEKIESIDNFHMLITEIKQKQYNSSNTILNICNIIAQLDQRTMQDERKLKILKDALIQNKIISKKNMSLSSCIMEIISLPEDRIGTIYLELCNYRDSFPSNIFADSIETYHFLTKTEKLSKNKKMYIQSVINKYNLNNNAKLSHLDIYDNLVENKKNSIVDFNSSLLSMNA